MGKESSVNWTSFEQRCLGTLKAERGAREWDERGLTGQDSKNGQKAGRCMSFPMKPIWVCKPGLRGIRLSPPTQAGGQGFYLHVAAGAHSQFF